MQRVRIPVALLFLITFGVVCYGVLNSFGKQVSKDINASANISIIEKADEALAFCKAKSYNTDFCILVDLGLHSGRKRFFVYDFKNDAISHSYLVSHGCGIMPWGATWSKGNARLSNADGSHCSSEGKYKIGKRGYSNWGVHVNYKLHGLDKTNSNALARQIVLHSWEEVPDAEVFPRGTPEGWGCPAISNQAFTKLDQQLKSAKKPVLLWIFKSN